MSLSWRRDLSLSASDLTARLSCCFSPALHLGLCLTIGFTGPMLPSDCSRPFSSEYLSPTSWLLVYWSLRLCDWQAPRPGLEWPKSLVLTGLVGSHRSSSLCGLRAKVDNLTLLKDPKDEISFLATYQQTHTQTPLYIYIYIYIYMDAHYCATVAYINSCLKYSRSSTTDLEEAKISEWMIKGKTTLIQIDPQKGIISCNNRPITCLPVRNPNSTD